MTQEDKELLLKDLCARLPYRPKVLVNGHLAIVLGIDENVVIVCIDGNDYKDEIIVSTDNNSDDIKPYLRTMSSMTDGELIEFLEIRGMNLNSEELKTFREGETAIVSTLPSYSRHIDWLNAHHFDYRGLIPKDLAIAVTAKNNPYK